MGLLKIIPFLFLIILSIVWVLLIGGWVKLWNQKKFWSALDGFEPLFIALG